MTETALNLADQPCLPYPGLAEHRHECDHAFLGGDGAGRGKLPQLIAAAHQGDIET